MVAGEKMSLGFEAVVVAWLCCAWAWDWGSKEKVFWVDVDCERDRDRVWDCDRKVSWVLGLLSRTSWTWESVSWSAIMPRRASILMAFC